MSPATTPPEARGRRGLPKRITRPVRAMVALVLLSILALWYAAETDFAAERMRRLLEARGSAWLGVPLRIGRLELDVLPPRLLAVDVDAPGRVRVDRVVLEVDPLGLVRNRLTLANVELHRPRIDLTLPEGGTGGPPGVVQLELRRLLVQDGELRFGSQSTRVSGELLGISTRLTPETSGLLAAEAGPSIGELSVASGSVRLAQRDGREYAFSPVEVRARYGLEARTLRIDDLHLVAGNNSVDVTGTLRGTRTADLQVTGDLAIRDVFELWVPPGPADHAGRARFVGSLQLRDGLPVLSGRIGAEGAVIAGLQVDEVETSLELHADAVSLRGLRARLYGGELDGELYVDRRQETERVRVDYRATGLDAAALTRWPALRGWRLAGAAQGQGSLAWSGPFLETAAGSGTLGLQLGVTLPQGADGPGVAAESHQHAVPTTHLVPALPIPAAAEFEYRLESGLLQLQRATVQVRGASVSANGRIDLDGAIALGVRLEGDDLALVDHLVAQYRAFRDQRPGARRLGISGAGSADLQVTGSLHELMVAGTVRARDLAVDDLQIGRVTATLRTEGRALLAENLLLTRGAGTASGSASLRLPGGQPSASLTDYDVRLQLNDYGVAAERGLGGLPFDANAVARGPFRIRGNWRQAPALEFDLLAEAPSLGTVTLSALQLRGRRSEGAWLLSAFRVDGLGGSVEGNGLWGPTDRRVLLEAAVSSLDVAAVCAALTCGDDYAGTLDGRVGVEGTIEALDGDIELAWTDAAAGGIPLGRVVGSARGEDGVFAARFLGSESDAPLPFPEVPRTTSPGTAPTLLPEPPQGWSAAMTVSSRAPWPAAVRARVGVGVAAALAGRWGHALPANVTIGGLLEARVRGDLQDWRRWQGEASVAGLRLQGSRGLLVTGDRAEAILRDGTLRMSATLRSDAGTLEADLSLATADGALGGRVDGHLDADVVALWVPDLRASGSVAAEVAIGGTLRDPDLRGRGEVRDLALDGGWMYPLAAFRANLELGDGEVRIADGSGNLGDRGFRVRGNVPLAAIAGDAAASALVRVEVDELDVMPLVARSAVFSQLITSGTLAGTVELRGTGTDWRTWTGDANVAALQLRLRDYRLDLARAVRVQLRNGALHIAEGTTLVDARTRLSLAGRIELAPLRLDLAATGALGFEPLNVLSSRWGTGGVADIDLRVHGAASDLAWSGSASVRDAVISPPVLRQPIDAIHAQVTFDERRIRIDSGSGQLGGGEVTLGGEIFLRDNAVQSFRLTASVASALLRLERDVQLRASANIVHDGTPQRSLMSGTVTLEEGLYRRELQPDSALLEMLEAPDTDPDPLLQSIALSLRLRGDGDLIIDNNLANVEITADLEVRGTAARPVLLGRSVVRGGRIFWNGNTFEVLQGTVEYSNPFETDPVFDIRSRTEIRRYTIDLSFNGSLQRGVRFNYTSTPPLSELDLFNLLAFNEEPGSTVLEDPTAYQRALGLQATRYLTDAYLAEVERGAARLFGIDRFRIAPTLSGSETDATARLTVGKRINRNLYVTYSRLLSTSEDQLLIVEYQLSPDIRVKGTREEDGSFGIDFFVQKRIR